MITVIFSHIEYKIDHQNEINPIQKDLFAKEYQLSLDDDSYMLYFTRWKIVKYSEENFIFWNLFGNNKEYYGGELLTTSFYKQNIIDNFKEYEKLGIKILDEVMINILDNNQDFDYYIRRKKSIFTSIANMFSLSMGLYNLFILIFCRFYSNSFDNYKIIEKILSKNLNFIKPKEIKEENKNKEIELKSKS